MKPDNLNLPDDLPFHYNREERLNQLPEQVRKNITGSRKKFFFDKRTLIVLIDIFLVLAAFGGITAFQKMKTRVTDFEGCRLEVKAVLYDNRILSSLKVTVNTPPEPGTLVHGEFFFDESREIVTVTDLIPGKAGEIRLLRAELNPPEEGRLLKVRVRIGDREKVLEKVIQGE